MKIATRFLLPLELFAGMVMLSWGVSGWLGGSGLWTMLAVHDQNLEWGLWLCGVGAAQFGAAAVEFVAGRDWRPRALLFAVSLRFWLAFLGIVVWCYVFFVVLTAERSPGVLSLAMQAPLALAFSAWIAWGNRRVACVLDPAVSTQGLQRQILAERRRGWSAEEDPAVVIQADAAAPLRAMRDSGAALQAMRDSLRRRGPR